MAYKITITIAAVAALFLAYLSQDDSGGPTSFEAGVTVTPPAPKPAGNEAAVGNLKF